MSTPTFSFGIDQLLHSKERLRQLQQSRVGLVAHPASVTSDHQHTVDALVAAGVNVVRAFGPQHGMRGDKQDNMIESEDYIDTVHQLPVTSLYGEHRYPTPAMLEDLDIVLFDLQDVGCRIYTYITTLFYFVEACAAHGKPLWVLDRPNPAGRPVDGLYLEDGEQSFVGCAPMPTRHGLTTGELSSWFTAQLPGDHQVTVIPMTGYNPAVSPGYGWPVHERAWVNPSPNASTVNMARCFPGTVLLEGTQLSEGRGTTTPLEVIGAPDFPARDILELLSERAPDWLAGVYIRHCYFETTFHKHQGTMSEALQFHTDQADYNHDCFKPYRLVAGCLKALRELVPDYDLWRYHPYEYEEGRTPIDVINGGPALREWVDGDGSFSDFDAELGRHEARWLEERAPHLLY